jgi:hypothetical protein
MRLFASMHIPKTPFRVGVITGPFGGHHPHPQGCPTCGVRLVHSRFLDWCVYIAAGYWVAHYLFTH